MSAFRLNPSASRARTNRWVWPGSTASPARRSRRPNKTALAARVSEGTMRVECSAVLFDLDGVLVDSTAYIEQQWRDWARSRGLDPEPFVRVCHGRRAVDTIRLAAPQLDAEAEVSCFRAEAPDEEATLTPVPGARELLAALAGSRWAVVTSGARRFALARLVGAGLPVPP